MSERTCSIPACTGKLIARGWCFKHYMRWRRTGTPYRPTTEQRFFADVQQSADGCWPWTGTCEERGYGNFYAHNKTYKAHRWSYEFFRVELPEELELDHLCLNKTCVNPWHLEPVPGIENQRRRYGVYGSDLRLCMHGHEMTPINTYINPRGVRCCRTCMRESRRRSRLKRSAILKRK